MICFCDTDILLKLTDFGLLDLALETIGAARPGSVYITTEVKAKCQSSGREHKDYRRGTLQTLLRQIQKFVVIRDAGDTEEAIAFADVDTGIDSGEAQLFLSTRNKTDFMLLSGDKRALRALTTHFLNSELHTRHKGRVMCLESVLLLLINTHGYARIRDGLYEGRTCDQAVRNAIRDGNATEPEVIASLQVQIDRLQFDTRGLLHL